MKLEVGMYCYNKCNRKAGIGRIISLQSNNNVNVKYKNDIDLVSIGNVVPSNKIIDLIEVGDYVNGYLVISINPITIRIEEYNNYWSNKIIGNNDIKSIVTKEQFSQMEYRLENE